MGKSTLEIYEKIQNGEFHKAVYIAEKEYQEDDSDQEALVNYVSVLLRLGHIDKAKIILVKGPHKPISSLSVYLLYVFICNRCLVFGCLLSFNSFISISMGECDSSFSN